MNRRSLVLVAAGVALAALPGAAQDPRRLIARPGLFQPLTEPPCSYVSTQNRKGMVRDDDRVLAWVRGDHNGGAIPLRHFLAGPRIINDTYGLFFYDPDGGYVSAFAKDYGYEFHGWRRGVMVARGRDGSLWSALSGIAFDGPQRGKRLKRQPSFLTEWGYWLMLHPESTAYDLFDGKKYEVVELPTEMHPDAKASMGQVDGRRPPLSTVIGVEAGGESRAYPADPKVERACVDDVLGGESITAFWYGVTRSGIAYSRRLEGQTLSFYADEISPETAPFKDRETGTRWSLAGRGIDGPLRGKELTWVDSVQCRWYAWAAEHPATALYSRGV